MCEEIRVFVSSKQSELDTERAIIREQAQKVGLIPILAEDWPPGRTDIRQVYLNQVRMCPIYIGVFYQSFSPATVEEYNVAKNHPYREILVYIRNSDEATRDPRLADVLRDIAANHVYFNYNKPEDLLYVIPKHLKAALSRMINLLISLGEAAQGGLSWGKIPDEGRVTLSPTEQFLSSIGFPDGQYDKYKADKILTHIQSVISYLDTLE